MHLLSCEHPLRVFNKYIGEYVWTCCGKCESCRNARAAKWTSRLERERLLHRYTFFVTLTYANEFLPVIDSGSFQDDYGSLNPDMLIGSRNDVCINYQSFLNDFCDDDKDRNLVYDFLSWYGIPYASSTDLQKFLKRLNKHIHDTLTHKFKNFRYFVCSEYGSGHLRPHFHGIFFVDDSDVAEHFKECLLHSWKFGRLDCQYVEKSACSYVSQYVNKSAYLPKFYQTGPISQKFFFSRFPTIGNVEQSDEEIQKSFDLLSVQRVDRKAANSTEFVLCPNDPVFENRLYPKCFLFSKVSDTCRVKLYTSLLRFPAESVREFIHMIVLYLRNNYEKSEYFELLRQFVGDIENIGETAENWLRRLYYISRRFVDNCKRFSLSVFDYYQRIVDYWRKKELFNLKQFYTFQEQYSKIDSDGLVFMYSEFAFANFGINWVKDLFNELKSPDVKEMFDESRNKLFRLTRKHQQNEYMAYMAISDNKPIYKSIKNFLYAKKCNEDGYAIAPQGT